jgi:hypothetical protein
MRTTVGPLPPAVYWRRRAVVLGALLLGLIVLFVSCSGGDDKTSKNGQSAASQLPTPAPASSTPDEQPSFITGQPNGGPSLPEPGDLNSPATNGNGTGTGTGTGQNGNVNVTAPAGNTCTDAEMSVTPLPAATTVTRGTPLELRLKIKNIGTRTCNRDVGAVAQELYIDQGAQKIWSSDTCGNATSSDTRAIPPGIELEYRVNWNGHLSTKCQNGLAVGPLPNAGVYEVRARLATKISDPVALTIVS